MEVAIAGSLNTHMMSYHNKMEHGACRNLRNNTLAPHLVVSISGNGYGHVAQVAPVLNLLFERMPHLRLTLRSTVPDAYLRSRINAPFNCLPGFGDDGMVMFSALDVNVAESRRAYRAVHAQWHECVDTEARLLRELRADMVLSNVGYLVLAGAQQAGIPNAALCSLNWFDIYRHYCGDDDIAAQIHACYLNADSFLRVTPGMAMTYLPNQIPVAPIAVVGNDRREQLRLYLKLSRQEKLVLVSLGGIASTLELAHWPRIDGVRWLVQNSLQRSHEAGCMARRPDIISLASLPLSFCDLLASCDVLICKPGYGSFVEAACSGTPVIYVNRPDWPESQALIAWLARHGVCHEISRQELEQGELATALQSIDNSCRPAPFAAQGAHQVVDLLVECLRRV